MTVKFDVRRRMLLGMVGSGLAAVLAGCADPYREPVILEEPEPERFVRPAPGHRRVIYRRKKLPVEPRSQPGGEDDAMPHGSGGGGSGGGGTGGGGGNGGGGNGGGGNGGGGGAGGGGGGGGPGGWSDRRLKTDIRALGQSAGGLPIYSFRYIWGGPVYVGVMAQDLLDLRPDAVITTDSGYMMVDYDLIDVKMTTLAKYKASMRQISR